MALDFPSSPTNNQVYENYIYNSTSGAWQKLPGNTFATTAISDTPPVNPSDGNLWWSNDEETGNTLKLYNGSSFVNAAPISNNAIINGDFGIWQRGTSFTGDEYTADRWRQNRSGGTSTVTRESFSPNDLVALGYGDAEYFLRQTTTVGNTNCGIQNRVEDVRVLAGQTITISFWAKGTNPGGGEFDLSVNQNFGSGGSSQVFGVPKKIVLSGSWQKFSETLTVPSVSGKTIGSGSYLEFYLRQPGIDSSTDAWEIDIWGVQLEAGSVATPFKLAGGGSKAAELALCQRYYWSSNDTGNGPIGFGASITTSEVRFAIPLGVELRGTPDTTLDAGWRIQGDGQIGTVSAITNQTASGNTLYLRLTPSFTLSNVREAYILTGGLIEVDSEL